MFDDLIYPRELVHAGTRYAPKMYRLCSDSAQFRGQIIQFEAQENDLMLIEVNKRQKDMGGWVTDMDYWVY